MSPPWRDPGRRQGSTRRRGRLRADPPSTKEDPARRPGPRRAAPGPEDRGLGPSGVGSARERSNPEEELDLALGARRSVRGVHGVAALALGIELPDRALGRLTRVRGPDDLTQVEDRVLALDAGLKYRGVFLQTEFYKRWLDDFEADGPLPVSSIVDKGFYVQAAFYPVPRKLELYAATSQIYGDKDAGFSNSHEYLGGLNYYLVESRNHRLNFQVIRVDRSPVNSTFGYYVGGQKGTTISAALSIFF